jgi:hypothetical protein
MPDLTPPALSVGEHVHRIVECSRGCPPTRTLDLARLGFEASGLLLDGLTCPFDWGFAARPFEPSNRSG